MGMSATQARYLSLVAQQSNLEYQGQQINQERSILSQQVSDLYNTLLALDVPTPPSTQEFTRVVYKCSVLGDSLSFNASNVSPCGDKTYNISFDKKKFGNSLSVNPGTISTQKNTGEVKGRLVSGAQTLQPLADAYETTVAQSAQSSQTAPNSGDYFMKKTSDTGATFSGDPSTHYLCVDIDSDGADYEFIPANPANCMDNPTAVVYERTNVSTDWSISDSWTIQEAETLQDVPVEGNTLNNLYIVDSGTNIRPATTDDVTLVGNKYYLKNTENYVYADSTATTTYTDTSIEENNGEYLISGNKAYDLVHAKDAFNWSDEKYNEYVEAVTNANLCAADGTPYGEDDFYVYKDSEGTLHFALKADVHDNNGATTYDFNPNGELSGKVSYENCLLEFDPSSGRITSISVPASTNSAGEVESYTKVSLEAATETDELAYENAMAQYEYAQHLYDKEQAEINAKTEKIQQMDRNLELKLQRLDTQRTQITTELDALEKVLNDNIEKSYKTFSG